MRCRNAHAAHARSRRHREHPASFLRRRRRRPCACDRNRPPLSLGPFPRHLTGRSGIHLAGFAFLGLLGIALARINVPVTNLTSPYRPHAERQHLAPGLVLVAILDKVAALSPAVTGFLLCAAGAALMDRVAESFAGRRALRAEIMMLGGSSALAGLGLLLAGAARLGAPWGEIAGLHVAFMGGLGLGVYAVFSIAGLLHTGRPLGIAPWTRAGAGLLCASVVLR
ncbi:MAG: NnrS family protein, partial [Pseudomonadota bacterium]